MKRIHAALAILALGAGLACATAATAQTAPQQAAMSSGEVKKVDKDAARITIKHGPLANLDMPAMTMVFKVKPPAALDQVKAGDKVSFTAEMVGGALTVTRLEPAK